MFSPRLLRPYRATARTVATRAGAALRERVAAAVRAAEPEVSDVLPQLYLHGLALGDFELALRGLFGEGAPLSASTVARVKERWHAEAAAWQERSLAELDLVYLWVDGVYVKAGLEKDKAALLVAIGGRPTVARCSSRCEAGTENRPKAGRDCCAMSGNEGFAVRGW